VRGPRDQVLTGLKERVAALQGIDVATAHEHDAVELPGPGRLQLVTHQAIHIPDVPLGRDVQHRAVIDAGQLLQRCRHRIVDVHRIEEQHAGRIEEMLSADGRDQFRRDLRPKDLAQFFISTSISMLLGVIPGTEDPDTVRRYIDVFVLPVLLKHPPSRAPCSRTRLPSPMRSALVRRRDDVQLLEHCEHIPVRPFLRQAAVPMRWITVAVIHISLPVAGMPGRSPQCVPRASAS
jgi:hypothetical protein